MTKLKKTYCILSLIFAIAVFVAVLFASQNRTTVYAASMDPDSSVTIAFDYAYIVYQNCNCTSFFKNGNWNTDGTAKPDFDWTGIVFDIFYHVADVSADQ